MSAAALRGNFDGHPAPDNREIQGDRSAAIAEWVHYAESLGLRRRHANYLVRYYQNHIMGDFDFYEWVLMHADPTGETATRNVMQERGY